MASISKFLLILSLAANIFAAELPRFLTKHAPETLRFMSMDGRYAYLQKKPGVLGFITSFKGVDFITETSSSDFKIKGSRFKQRLVIESIPNAHDEYNLIKTHKIYVVDYGNSVAREIGQGRGAKLHIGDEWISYYDGYTRFLHIQNLVTQKKYDIRLSSKANPFFTPEVEMISSNVVVYTDINEMGLSAVVAYDLAAGKSSISYRSQQTATRVELCQHEDYVAIGEFPYDGVSRGSKILQIKKSSEVNLSGHSTIYSSVEQDIGNIVCLKDSVYFVKTLNQNKELNLKVTEAAKYNLNTQKIEIRSNLKHVTQLVEMDGRVIIPLRGEFFVLEGTSNLGVDTLKATPSREELQIDL